MSVPKIYTDGSCLVNPGGNGGWAVCFVEENYETFIAGNEISTTNNRMELQAIIEALKYAQHKEYDIYTDSQWVINCASGKWKRKANLDLWKEFDKLSNKYTLHWNWVRGHNGDKYNTIVDKLAREEALLLR